MTRTPLAAAIVAVALLVACGSASNIDNAADPQTVAPTTDGSAVESASPSAVPLQPAGPTAQQVVDAFKRAGLPVPNPRDNSGNCKTLGCVQLITTDAISVYSWPTEATAQHQVDVAAGEAYQRGLIVLSYAAARTPAKDRPRYEEELAKIK